MDYDRVLSCIVAWGERNDNVRCIVLTGSAAASSSHPLSDRDIELHLRERESLEEDDSWWNRLGEVLAVERLENAADQPTRIVYYAGGKLDFTLIALDDGRGTSDRPFQILLDKDGDGATFRLEPPSFSPPLRVSLTPGRRFRKFADSDFSKYGTVIPLIPGQSEDRI